VNVVVSSDTAAGARSAAKTPWQARAVTSIVKLTEAPPAAEAAAKPASPIKKVTLRPIRSASRRLGWLGSGGCPPALRQVEPVEALPAGDHHQPSPYVLDRIGRSRCQAGERLLYHVLGIVLPSQYPRGDRQQVPAVSCPRSLNQSIVRRRRLHGLLR
jgi:hypothetical protein